MKSVLTEFSYLWPSSSLAALRPILDGVEFLYFPDDLAEIQRRKRLRNAPVIVIKDAKLSDIIHLLEYGFEHCVQQHREDFAKELLAACLMRQRRSSFANDPMPLLIGGSRAQSKSGILENELSLPLASSSDKQYVISRLELFLMQNPRLAAMQDAVIQVADEQITNALFSAPVNFHKEPLFADLNRSDQIVMPVEKIARFIASFSDQRIVIACEDAYGSIRREKLLEHLASVFKQRKVAPRNYGSGAGLGFKFMIENSTNFNLYCERGRRTIVSCAFSLNGLRKNRAHSKSVHVVFVELPHAG